MQERIQKTLDTVLGDNAKEGTYRVAATMPRRHFQRLVAAPEGEEPGTLSLGGCSINLSPLPGIASSG